MALLMAGAGQTDALAGVAPCWKILGIVSLVMFLPLDTPAKNHLSHPAPPRAEFVSRAVEFQVRQLNGDPGQISLFDNGWLHQQVAAKIKDVLVKEQPSLSAQQGWAAPGWLVKIDKFFLEKASTGEWYLRIVGPYFDITSTEGLNREELFSGEPQTASFRFTKVYPDMGTAVVNVSATARYDDESHAFLLNKLDGSVEVSNSLFSQSDDFSVGPWIAAPTEQTTFTFRSGDQ
jgi:hypothetical protein